MAAIDELIEEKHLLTHPFYVRWQNGGVPREVLQEYARQYYAYESALPSFLEDALAHLEPGPAREAVSQNLADEAGGPVTHPELWLRFAEGLGVPREEVRGAEPLPGTAHLVDTYSAACRAGAASALGAIYAYEAQFAAVARTKAEGLRRFYGVTDQRSLEFFDLHSTLDDDHAAWLREGMDGSADSSASAGEALRAWWGMLDQFERMCAAN